VNCACVGEIITEHHKYWNASGRCKTKCKYYYEYDIPGRINREKTAFNGNIKNTNVLASNSRKLSI
jgi:hypothetical protein